MDTIHEAAGLQSYIRRTGIYIAARYGRKEEALRYALELEERGYVVTSTWVRQKEDEMLYKEGPLAAGRFAQKDYEEIRAADILVYLSEQEDNTWGRGGRHVEFGYAAALGKRLVVVGPLENIFHYHSGVFQFDGFSQFLRALE